MNTVDLNKCLPGQKLRRRDGLLMEYVERNTSLGEYFPHIVKHSKLGFVDWYTGAGKISVINPEESPRDIVEIIEMNKPTDDGPAFPVVGQNVEQHPGMSLRAYLAAQETLADIDIPGVYIPIETQELLAGRKKPCESDRRELETWYCDWRASLKVMRADALIRALEKGEK